MLEIRRNVKDNIYKYNKSNNYKIDNNNTRYKYMINLTNLLYHKVRYQHIPTILQKIYFSYLINIFKKFKAFLYMQKIILGFA